MSKAAWDAVKVKSKARGSALAVLEQLAYYSYDALPPFTCSLTQETLHRLTHVSKRSIRFGLVSLQELGEVTIQKRGRTNVYSVTLALATAEEIAALFGHVRPTEEESFRYDNEQQRKNPSAIQATEEESFHRPKQMEEESFRYDNEQQRKNPSTVQPRWRKNPTSTEEESFRNHDPRDQVISGLRAQMKGVNREAFLNGDSGSLATSQRENYPHSEREKEETPEETRRHRELDVDTLWRLMREQMTPWFSAAQAVSLVNGGRLIYKEGQLILKARSSDAARMLILRYQRRIEDLVAYHIDEPPPLVIQGPLGAVE